MDDFTKLLLEKFEKLDEKIEAKFEKLDSKIDSKFDILSTRIDSIDVTLGKQEVSLKDHIRRTELLEAETKNIRQTEVDCPAKKRIIQVEGALILVAKVLGIIGVVVGIVAAVVSLS